MQQKLSGQIFVYGVGDILNKAIPFALLPILTHYITPEEYGQLSNVQVLIAFLTPFVLINIHGAMNVNFFKLDIKEFEKYMSSNILLPFYSYAIILGILYLFKDLILEYLEVPFKWSLIASLICLFQCFIQIVQVILVAQKRAKHYVITQVGQTIINVMLSLLFVVTLKYSWEGRMLGVGIASSVFFLYSFWFFYKEHFIFNGKNNLYIKDALKFGIPLIPHAIGMWIINMSNRVLLTKLTSLEEVGLYSFAFQFGLLISVVSMAIQKAWMPSLYEKLGMNKEEEKKKIVLQSYKLMGLLIVFTILLSILAPVAIKLLFNESYYKGIAYIPWIAFSYCFQGFTVLIGSYIMYSKKTQYLAFTTVFSAVINIVLNYFFIKHSGGIGAAQATLISFALTFFLTWYLSNKLFPMPWFSFYNKK